MKIAFTHNLRLSASEEEAEFDSPETVGALADAMTRLGHDVHLVDVAGSTSRLVVKLENLRPDLVFNTAEGTVGAYREAFYPALFEQLGLAFTGSDARVCALTLDKHATKLVVADRGVPTPRWHIRDRAQERLPTDLRFPVIVKPNFEGSSKGITQASVVETPEALAALVEQMTGRYDALLIEEYVEGIDVTVPFLAAAGGVLTPASYEFDAPDRRWALYDYELKNDRSDAVHVRVPAAVSEATASRLRELTARVVQTLGLEDLGRVDFRVTPDDEIYFIEVNALPSLEPGASLYESAALAGLETVEEVLDAVISNAIDRQHVVEHRHDEELRVGLTYNLKRIDPRSGSDVDAEYDSPETVGAIREALESLGHEVVELEATPELLGVLPTAELDVVFNIAEGLHGRNREAQIPALLELLEIPYTGSDPAALAITLDKGLAKRSVRAAGWATARSALCATVEEVDGLDLRFPVIAKPNAEGSSKGVTRASVCENVEALRERVAEMTSTYHQTALVEEFLPGREFTVAVLGDDDPRALPPMEIVFDDSAGPHPVYTYGHKIETESGVRYVVPADVDDDLGRALAEHALGVFETLGCRDVARIDIRLDADGQPNFIECNPLPGLTPGWSDLCQIATAAGIDYTALIAAILAGALRRMRDPGQR